MVAWKGSTLTATDKESPSRRGGLLTKIVVFVVLAAVAALGYMRYGDALTLAHLAEQEQQLRTFQQAHPIFVYGLAFAIYVAVTGLSLPGATVLTLVYGWYFGLLPGIVLVSFASTAGATLAFLLSRFLFRDVIHRRFGERLASFNRSLEREGPFFLFTLRLVPLVPFFVINAVMGLTPLRAWTFWWVSQVGMFAGTIVYVYAGSSVPDLQALADEGINAVFSAKQLTQLGGAFALLGIFPLATRWIFVHWMGRSSEAEEVVED
jgi:uncharacterized membrane protein YdjX (TVP38/TMEM64 family)